MANFYGSFTGFGASATTTTPDFIGDEYGYNLCGSGSMDTIDRFSLTSQADSTDVGDMFKNIENTSGNSSQTHGYSAGENAAPNRVIAKVQFVATAAGTDVGDLSIGRYSPAGCSYTAGARGYACGGDGSEDNRIDRISHTSDIDSVDVANMTNNAFYHAGASSADYGYVAGGLPSNDVINRFSFAAETDATDVGDLSSGRWRNSAATKGTQDYGYTFGYYPGGNSIDKYQMVATANGSDVANLHTGEAFSFSISAREYAYVCGGRPATNQIQQYNTATDADAIDWANLTRNSENGAACQF